MWNIDTEMELKFRYVVIDTVDVVAYVITDSKAVAEMIGVSVPTLIRWMVKNSNKITYDRWMVFGEYFDIKSPRGGLKHDINRFKDGFKTNQNG